jgi:hypothetical protein
MAKSSKRKIEQYLHTDKKRANNPPVGLVTHKDAGKKTYAYDPHLDPSLQWAGKAEHTSFDVPTVRPIEESGRSRDAARRADASIARSEPTLRQAEWRGRIAAIGHSRQTQPTR